MININNLYITDKIIAFLLPFPLIITCYQRNEMKCAPRHLFLRGNTQIEAFRYHILATGDGCLNPFFIYLVN